jgi:hypothetical protein
MSEQLEFPDHEWKTGLSRPAIEVSIDFLPAEYKGAWHRAIHEFAARWVKAKKFQKTATIWMWGTISTNLVSRHPENPVPSWSDFLIQFGLPEAFWTDLEQHLAREFAGQCAITMMVEPSRDDGWTPICHIEQGQVWKEVDADTWEPFVPS